MPAIPYVPQTWTDGVSAASGARMTVLETGIKEVSYAPCVRAWAGAATSTTNATFTTLALNSEDFDQAGNAADTMHDTVTNNSRLTCRYAGVYAITGHGSFALSAGGATRQLRVFLNNTTEICQASRGVGSASIAAILNVSTLYKLAVNDFVELQAFQDSGGALNFTASSFTMARVG